MAKMVHASRRQQQSGIAPVLVVLILALAVQGTAGQLWEKLPILGRFSKAAQAAKAAAAAITVHSTTPSSSTPTLPPAPSTPVVAAVQSSQPSSAAAEDAKQKGGGKKGKGKKLGTTGRNDTQAGCSCLSEWEIRPGGAKLSGCANPDNDPLGAWCPVDPNECLGYYSMYRTEKGKLRFFDYCVPVRERTKKGCLCSGDWSAGDGSTGKAHYRDGCARPHSPQGPRVCKVDSATCPPGVEIEGFDECVDKQEQMVLTLDKTWHNCGCIQGWHYKYEDGTSAIFSTCANPDLDPLGPWCEVDPSKCDSFATVVKNGNRKMSIDYCRSKFKEPEPAGCSARLKLYDQCGGKSNCTHTGCLNAPWPGACCPKGSECRYQDAFYYQCLPLDIDMSVKAYKTAPGGPSPPSKAPAPPPAKKSAPAPAAPAPKAPTPQPAEKTEIALSSLEEVSQQQGAAAAGQDGGVREAGSRVWVKLRLGMDYDLLVAQPQRMAAFKSDIAHWLREVVGDTKYIYGTGVDEVVSGSVIAVSYVDFTKDAPSAAVDAAMEQLHTTGQTMYADSQLPQKWGWVLSYNMGQNKTDLMQDTPGEVQIQSMNFPPGVAKPKARRPTNLSLTAAVVIAVVGMIVLLGLVCGVVAYRRRAARRRTQVQGNKPGKQQGGKPGGKEQQGSHNNNNNNHHQSGGIGGTPSGYLADLDGMDDGMSEKMTKKSFGRSSMFNSAESTLARVGQGLKGVLKNPSARHAMSREASAAMNAAGGAAGQGGSKRPSESGATSRLWNWLQKAETPAVDEPLHNNGTSSGLSSPEVSCNISTRGSSSKNSPRPVINANGVLPSPRNSPLMPLPVMDLSDPGGAFRVPPPSPRYTERANGLGSSPAEAAAAAVAAAAATGIGGPTPTSMLSPRPAPGQATLVSGGSKLSNNTASVISYSDSRRAPPPLPLPSRAGAGAAPSQMASPRPAAAAAAAAAGPHSYSIDPLNSNASAYTAASDYAAPASYGAPEPRAPQGPAGNGSSSYCSTGMRRPGLNMGGMSPETGELPPGISMGPFLRAAIKSLTGQSLGDSPYNSEGGEAAAAAAAAAGGSGGYAPSSNTAGVRSPSPGGGHGHAAYGGLAGAGSFNGRAGSVASSTTTTGTDAMAAAVRANAQATAEREAALEGMDLSGSGSVFQSLWMQRLVAAAQAQQGDGANSNGSGNNISPYGNMR